MSMWLLLFVEGKVEAGLVSVIFAIFGGASVTVLLSTKNNSCTPFIDAGTDSFPLLLEVQALSWFHTYI
jgi:hypothetical protein